MDEHRALEELQREIRDRRRLGMPTGDLPEQEAELRRELRLPAPPRKQKPPAAPKKGPNTHKQRRPMSNAQRKQLERWHREHNSRGGVR